jgi:hypothetical protein
MIQWDWLCSTLSIHTHLLAKDLLTRIILTLQKLYNPHADKALACSDAFATTTPSRLRLLFLCFNVPGVEYSVPLVLLAEPLVLVVVGLVSVEVVAFISTSLVVIMEQEEVTVVVLVESSE